MTDIWTQSQFGNNTMAALGIGVPSIDLRAGITMYSNSGANDRTLIVPAGDRTTYFEVFCVSTGEVLVDMVDAGDQFTVDKPGHLYKFYRHGGEAWHVVEVSASLFTF